MHNIVPVTVVKSTENLPAEFPRLLFFEPSVASQVMQKIAIIDVF
jgi:hypothetical protein